MHDVCATHRVVRTDTEQASHAFHTYYPSVVSRNGFSRNRASLGRVRGWNGVLQTAMSSRSRTANGRGCCLAVVREPRGVLKSPQIIADSERNGLRILKAQSRRMPALTMSWSKKFTLMPASITCRWALMPLERGLRRNNTRSATSRVSRARFLRVVFSAKR